MSSLAQLRLGREELREEIPPGELADETIGFLNRATSSSGETQPNGRYAPSRAARILGQVVRLARARSKRASLRLTLGFARRGAATGTLRSTKRAWIEPVRQPDARPGASGRSSASRQRRQYGVKIR